MAAFPGNERCFLFNQNAQLDEDSNQKYQCHNEEKEPHNGLKDRVLGSPPVRSDAGGVVEMQGLSGHEFREGVLLGNWSLYAPGIFLFCLYSYAAELPVGMFPV